MELLLRRQGWRRLQGHLLLREEGLVLVQPRRGLEAEQHEHRRPLPGTAPEGPQYLPRRDQVDVRRLYRCFLRDGCGTARRNLRHLQPLGQLRHQPCVGGMCLILFGILRGK